MSKNFPGVQALSHVSLQFDAGKVHALVGENGAGKSTLLKTLSGLYQPSSGHLELAGLRCNFHGPQDALRAGIAVIYQELNLVPTMSIAENLLLGHQPQRFGIINKKQLQSQSLAILATLGENFDPATKLGRLSLAQRQVIEIAKAIARDAQIIAFDEPTSSLAEREIEKLFSIIKALRAQGKTIIYVSHRLQEIFSLCDTITIFKDGQLVEHLPDLHQTSTEEIIYKMVGRPLSDMFNYQPRAYGPVALALHEVEGKGLHSPISLEVRQGEVLGIFGLIGAGRTELLRLIYGAEKLQHGSISLQGKILHRHSIAAAIRAGLVLCPEDRKKEGIVGIRSVCENINLSVRRSYSRIGIIHLKKEIANAHYYIKKLAIKTPSIHQKTVNLSGGNQQKVILARWLSENSKVFLFDEPTRGIDVGVKSEIYSIIFDLAQKGYGIIFVSSDLPEVLGLADRIVVMREGSIAAEVMRAEASEEKIISLALPIK